MNYLMLWSSSPLDGRAIYINLFPGADDRVMLKAAMDHWMAETCITFSPYDPNMDGSDAKRLYFTAENSG